MKLALLAAAVIGSLCTIANAQAPKKGAPPPAATPAAADSAVPAGPIRLARMPNPAGAPGAVWLDEASAARTGETVRFRLVGVFPADSPAGGKTASAMWTLVSGNCAAGSVAPVAAGAVDMANQPVGPKPPMPATPPAKPPAGTPLATALALLCGTAAGDTTPRATSLASAIGWSRDNTAWTRAVAQAATPPRATTAVAAAPPPPPGSEPAPARTTQLVDMQVAYDGVASFFSLYIPENQDRFADAQWIFMPSIEDTPITVQGRTVNVAGGWVRLVLDCDGKRMTASDYHVVLTDGATVRWQPPTLEPPGDDGWVVPKVDSARYLASQYCPDIYEALSMNIKKGLYSQPVGDALAAVRASRRSYQPSAADLEVARYCTAFALRSYNLATGLESWADIGWKGKLNALNAVLDAIIVTATEDRAAGEAAGARATARIAALAPDKRANPAIAAELDACLTKLPLSAEPGQFARTLAGK